MKDTSNDSKSFPPENKEKISFPWRDKRLKKKFHWTEFINPKLKKIVLEEAKGKSKGKGGEDGREGKGKEKERTRRR